MTSEKTLTPTPWLRITVFAFAFAVFAGCGERHVPPNETRAEGDVFESRLEALHAEAKGLRTAEHRAAHELAKARAARADAAQIAALEKAAADAKGNLMKNIERQQAVCDERRRAEERSRNSKR